MTNMSVTFILVSARLFLPKSDLILATQKGGNKPNNNLFIYFLRCKVGKQLEKLLSKRN